LLNIGTAFTQGEPCEFALRGLPRPYVESLAEQVVCAYRVFHARGFLLMARWSSAQRHERSQASASKILHPPESVLP
jgi:hypothetical protein